MRAPMRPEPAGLRGAAVSDLGRSRAAQNSDSSARNQAVDKPKAGADTRLDSIYTAPFGCRKLRAVVLQHKRDSGGGCHVVALQVPEVSRRKIKASLAWARANRARVVFVCDTADQAQQMLEQAARLLPDHRRVALERAAAAGGFGLH
jgi:hypothetical protein